MCSKQALPLNETMTCNNVLTPLVLVTNKNDKLQPDGLQSTPADYQGCFGFIGQILTLSVRLLAGVIMGHFMT